MQNVQQLSESSEDRVKNLARKWVIEGGLGEEEFDGLTPDEARMVAYYAGFDTNHELHVDIREGFAAMAGEKLVRVPEDRFHLSNVVKLLVFKDGLVHQFETIEGAIIRLRIGDNQVDIKRKKFGASEQELVSHILRTLKPGGNQTCEWQGIPFEVSVRELSMWVLRHKDGSVYQLHPDYAYGFAKQKMRKLIETNG